MEGGHMTVMRVVVHIPAYNEERTIVEVIRGLKQRGFTTLIVVDDGSSDRTGALASDEGVIRLRHLLNRGLGGALGTGISAALRLGAEVIVTFDADGQHNPNDIMRLLEPIEAVRNRLKWEEVPVQAIYTDYSLSKGQSFTVGLQTLFKLILTRVQRSML